MNLVYLVIHVGTGGVKTNYDYTSGDAYGVAAQYTIDKTRLYATYDVIALDAKLTKTKADAKGDTLLT